MDDDEKPYLMAGSAAFVLPSKPRPEFVETFGIALVEKMLSGGGPVITTDTGGIGEAVGDTALIVPVIAVGWAVTDKTRWSNLVLAVVGPTIAVMLHRMQVIWFGQW